MNQLGVLLQQSSVRVQSDLTPSLTFLTSPQPEVEDRESRIRKSLKQVLWFMGVGCCGQHSFVLGEEVDRENHNEGDEVGWNQVCASGSPRMNLGAAMAVEAAGAEENATATPARVSLMRLLEETEKESGFCEGKKDNRRDDPVCCICMARDKGAAFIPCGHTYCRACSREVWVNRGTCPLCNRLIIDVLDIY